jgi:hypothetical protein
MRLDAAYAVLTSAIRSVSPSETQKVRILKLVACSL